MTAERDRSNPVDGAAAEPGTTAPAECASAGSPTAGTPSPTEPRHPSDHEKAADIGTGTDTPGAGADTPKRLAGDERRREILAAVREVSAEQGVSHLSVSAVTKSAGCTRSLFYHYFCDMDDAVAAVMDEAIEDFIAELETWNAQRTEGDIEGALDTVAPLFKRLVADGQELPNSLTAGSGALFGGFLHNVVERVARYICDTTVVDFVRLHPLEIDHVYETFYTLVMGLLMYIRTHPDVPDETVKGIIASTLHIDGYTAKRRRPGGAT